MPGRAPLRGAGGALGAWLLGGLWVWGLGGLGGLGAGALRAEPWGPPGTPRPCRAPQQWEGRQVLYRQSSGRYSRALLSYDGLNQRVRVLDERKALIPCKRYAGAGGGRVGSGFRGLLAGAGFPAAHGASFLPKRNFSRSIDPVGVGWRTGPAGGCLLEGTKGGPEGREPVKREPGGSEIILPGRPQALGALFGLGPVFCPISSWSDLRGRHPEHRFLKD